MPIYGTRTRRNRSSIKVLYVDGAMPRYGPRYGRSTRRWAPYRSWAPFRRWARRWAPCPCRKKRRKTTTYSLFFPVDGELNLCWGRWYKSGRWTHWTDRDWVHVEARSSP